MTLDLVDLIPVIRRPNEEIINKRQAKPELLFIPGVTLLELILFVYRRLLRFQVFWRWAAAAGHSRFDGQVDGHVINNNCVDRDPLG